jgi:hypothetical protein
MEERKQFSNLLQQGKESSEKTLKQMIGVTQLARKSVYEITGDSSYVIVRPDLTPTETNTFPLTVTVCVKCEYSVPNALIYVQDDPNAHDSGRLVYHETVDPGYGEILPYRISPPLSGERTYWITVLARTKPTEETLKVRLNPKSGEWEFSWHIVRTEKYPHHNPKTGLAEGAVFKVLEDLSWTSFKNTQIDPAKTKVVH